MSIHAGGVVLLFVFQQCSLHYYREDESDNLIFVLLCCHSIHWAMKKPPQYNCLHFQKNGIYSDPDTIRYFHKVTNHIVTIILHTMIENHY